MTGVQTCALPICGDQIVVRSIPFDQPPTEARSETWAEKNAALIRTGVKYGALMLATLLILLFAVRPARRALLLAAAPASPRLLEAGAPAALPPREAARDALLAGEDSVQVGSRLTTPRTVAEIEADMEAKVAAEMTNVAPETVRASTLRKQLTERAKKNPEAIAMTLRGWLNEKTNA